ncbi:Aste57867_24891 [Aphanomyces stellatus]|uniref:Aste57867_24891 protein n=1 Tax=Aphanomyces stellatus TaxID=120398 RepID=A0A485LRR0_9STRA|nr:hypothetical protein As57867_024813 [Aphanomyces stellatus]VFU01525.1 Aste57867_24891 [Aphanomyces stellatus]
MVKRIAVLAAVLVCAAAQTMGPTDFSCQPIEEDTDYESVPLQLQTTTRATAEECCEDCRRFEHVCDFYTWTSENGGTCELKKLQQPRTQVSRAGARSAFLIPCKCTKGPGCDAEGTCNGCSLFGTCYKYDAMACTHSGGAFCNGAAPTPRGTTTRVPTTKPNGTTTLPPTTDEPSNDPTTNTPATMNTTTATPTIASPAVGGGAPSTSVPSGSSTILPSTIIAVGMMLAVA